jgi:SlyX protein
MEQRLVDLEVRIAYQDRTIAELDEVVREFTKRIIELERELAALRATLTEPQEAIRGHDEPPPHY